MRLKLLVVFGVCLLLTVPVAQGADKEDSYAKVEVKGKFAIEPAGLERMPYQVHVGQDTYGLDFREKVDQAKLKKLNGKTVIIKGALDLDTMHRYGRRPIIVVSSINDANVM
jgi:hypothetical protein